MSEDKLQQALLKIEDIFGRMLCPFILLGGTAKGILHLGDERLEGDKIEVGIQRKQLTKEALSTLDVYLPDRKIETYGFSIIHDGVPVEVRIIERKYKFLKNTDFRFYRAGEYMIPNPFEEYWKVRGLIK